SSPGTVSVSVVNTAPTVPTTSQSFSVVHDRAYSYYVSGSDQNGDVLQYIVDTKPQHGTLTIQSNGYFTYTPNLHYVGQDGFVYHLHRGIASSSPGTVSLSVVNTAPTVPTTAQSFNVVHDRAYSYSLLASDSNNDTLTYLIQTYPQHGTLNIQNGS